MIIVHRNKDRRIVYYNLKYKSAHILESVKGSDEVKEIPQPWERTFVESLIWSELAVLKDSVDFIQESGENATPQDKLDLIRFNQNIEYLINYEY
jgi:hypothetical protein